MCHRRCPQIVRPCWWAVHLIMHGRPVPPEDLTIALATGGGIVARGDVRDHTIDNGARSGLLVRVFPGVYAVAGLRDDPEVRRRAALRYGRGRAALSHTSALCGYGLIQQPTEPVHLTTAAETRLRTRDDLVVHRRTGFTMEPPHVVHREGRPLVRLDRALVESWPLLDATERRAPLITAVRARRTTAGRLLAELAALPRLTDRRALLHLIGLLQSGCQSELEIWGLEHVFDHPSLPPSVAQHPLRVAGRVVYLDRAYPMERVDVELDGAAYHSSATDRERDRRRDAWLARLGWLTVRFGYQRLTTQPAEARRELLEILSVRRRQLAG